MKFDVVFEPEATYYPIEKGLSEKIQSEARKHGVSSDTLVNLWLEQENQGTEIYARRPEIIGKERIALNPSRQSL